MGILKTLGNIGQGISSIANPLGALVGIGSGIAGLVNKGSDNKKQVRQQKELMDYQNDINKANSLLDYQRQRQLTVDNATLQKLGLKQAGQNTALGDGSVASAASVGGTSSPNPPSALPSQSSIDAQYTNMINDSSQSLINASLARSQKQLIDEQAENQRIRNITQLKRDIADYTKLKNEAKNISDRNRYRNMLDEAESQYYKMNAKHKAWSLEDDTTMKDLQADMYADMQNTELESKRAYYQNLLDTHDLNKQEKAFYQYKVKHILSQIELNIAQAQDARSHVGVNEANKGLLKQDTKNKQQDYEFNQQSWSDRLAAIKLSSVPQNLYQKIQLWHKDGTFEKLDGFQQLGYSIYEACSSLGIKPSDAIQLAKLLK